MTLPASLTVESMTADDLHDVHRIDLAVYSEPWSLVLWKQELSKPRDRLYLVARTDENVVGHIGLLLVLDEAHLSTVAVDPGWHGRGVATALLLAAFPRAIERGTRALTLEVRVTNERAQRLYRRFGFAPAGIRKNYYSDDNEDALIMWAHDVDAPEYAARLAGIAVSVGERAR